MKPQVPLLPELLDVFKPSGLLAPISSNANIKCHPISSNAIFFNYLSTYGVSYYDLICLCHNRVCIILICKEVKGTITIHLDIIVVNSNLIYCLINKCILYWNVFTYGTKNIFRWDKMRDMTWCKLYTHLSWSWCMKKPNSGNSGVRNIVHSASPRCTIFRTPLLPSLGFFIHHSQERCVYTKTLRVKICFHLLYLRRRGC